MSTTRKYELRLSSTSIFAAALEKCKENVVFSFKNTQNKEKTPLRFEMSHFLFCWRLPLFSKKALDTVYGKQ